MVKSRKAKKPAKKQQKRGLSHLKLSASEERRRDAEDAAVAGDYAAAADRGRARTLGAAPVSSFGLMYSARTRDAARSGGRDARIALRLHPDLRDMLVLCSQKEHRTLSQLVELILMEFASGAAGRLTTDDLRLLGWDDAKIDRLKDDPHPFARELYARLRRGF